MNLQPLVSVLMTAYNREKYIAEAIESVLASTYTNFELIIVDDCSTDGTVAIAKKYAARDERAKVFVNEKNLGQFPNRNKIAEYANGEYLFPVDSDDSIYPDTIANLINVMAQYPEASFGMYAINGGDLQVIDSKTAIFNHFFKKPFLTVGPGGTIIKSEYFNAINKYPTEYGVSGDMYFNLKACCYSPVILLPFEFLNYRRHEGQEINNSFSYLYNNYKYLNDALNELPLGLNTQQKSWLSKKSKRRFFTNICKYFFSTFNFKKTRFAIKQANYTLKDAMIGIFHFD